MLTPLITAASPLAWLLAMVFGGICLIQLLKEQATVSPGSPTPAIIPLKTGPSMSEMSPPLTVLNRAFRPSEPRRPTAASVPERPTAWSRQVIDRMEWKRFEDLCCEFYRVKGIRAETTHLGADGGVDVRLFQDDAEPQRCTAIVQSKAWNQAVGVKPVRELRGVMAHEEVEKAFFMAPNGFTKEAKAFALKNRITLLDGKLFLAMLERLPEASHKQLLAFATEGEWTTPTCPSCGAKMAARDSKRGRFWGCATYPRCRATLPMRASAA